MNKLGLESARQRGDGMENESLTLNRQEQTPKDLKLSSPSSSLVDVRPRCIPGEHLIYKPNTGQSNLPAFVPKGKIFHLVPKLVYRNKKPSIKNKEPRFVPFEPYKAAINPIIPYKKTNPKVKINRNNLDLNILVSQMSDLKTSELNQIVERSLNIDTVFDSERAKFEAQIIELKRERNYFENELKFQSQVNSELKKLLVAAVGEDIQSKVNVLTEDKLQLARALLDTAQNLSSHTEQIEYLAGQSEVWRSKFLASSLMVEELARWKASLTQKNNSLFSSNKQMLETISQLREMQIEILGNLKFLMKFKSLNLKSSNVLDLSAESLNISQHLILHSGIGMPDNINLDKLDPLTLAEKQAIEAIEASTQPLINMDDAFKALFGKVFSSIISKHQKNDNETEVKDDKPIS